MVKAATVQLATIPALRVRNADNLNSLNLERSFFQFNNKYMSSENISRAQSGETFFMRNFPEFQNVYAELQKKYDVKFRCTLEKCVESLIYEEPSIELIVFPEYSIPFSALTRLSEISRNKRLIIVAGTHSISKYEFSNYPYINELQFQLGDQLKDIENLAICPVFLPERKRPHLFFKQQRSKYELNPKAIDIPKGITRTNLAVRLRDGRNINLACAICFEFLDFTLSDDEEALPSYSQVSSLLDSADVIVVPAMSPSTVQFSERAASLYKKRPRTILISNWSISGGSQIVSGCNSSGLQAGFIKSRKMTQGALVDEILCENNVSGTQDKISVPVEYRFVTKAYDNGKLGSIDPFEPEHQQIFIGPDNNHLEPIIEFEQVLTKLISKNQSLNSHTNWPDFTRTISSISDGLQIFRE